MALSVRTRGVEHCKAPNSILESVTELGGAAHLGDAFKTN